VERSVRIDTEDCGEVPCWGEALTGLAFDVGASPPDFGGDLFVEGEYAGRDLSYVARNELRISNTSARRSGDAVLPMATITLMCRP
jgi:hypothetical protein